MSERTFHNPRAEETPCGTSARGMTKRAFLGYLVGTLIAAGFGIKGVYNLLAKLLDHHSHTTSPGVSQGSARNRRSPSMTNRTRYHLGTDPDGRSEVFLAYGGSPESNMARILDALGGIGKLIDADSIVILKPNTQWWAQGMTNTNSMQAFMEAVLAIPGFHGEIIIADNHQHAEPNSRGWTTDQRNGDFNYNELVAHFQQRGYANVTKYHWRGAGPNPNPIEGDDQLGSRIVKGPQEGDGYVWSTDIVYISPLGRRCLLTWPVFKSPFSGVTIDFKNGIWKDGAYTGQPLKFINFAAINHHGPYVGVTASVKNYMGIVDMTCGFQGTTPRGYYNTHFIGLRGLRIPLQDHLPFRVRNWVNEYNWRYFEHTGGVLGTFMREVRMADMNFITAHWIGWGSRTRADKSGHPKALLASKDPVAADYAACQELLLPLTRQSTSDEYLLRINDASLSSQPFPRFLHACFDEGIGNINPDRIDLKHIP